ncbi:MAG: AbrB/MazE/SpoVT family DNA-binding domain-containing protein [Deltaproteobacteria bacterium]|nr:AbrB/MazE/SpoVT family DNA-binding domain-containing protein [Deltaproteobacteria bacterium]
MATAESKITSKGQVTLPSAIRTRLGVVAGDRVEWTTREDGVVELRKVSVDGFERLVGLLGRPPRHASVEEMDAAVRRRFSRVGG